MTHPKKATRKISSKSTPISEAATILADRYDLPSQAVADAHQKSIMTQNPHTRRFWEEVVAEIRKRMAAAPSPEIIHTKDFETFVREECKKIAAAVGIPLETIAQDKEFNNALENITKVLEGELDRREREVQIDTTKNM